MLTMIRISMAKILVIFMLLCTQTFALFTITVHNVTSEFVSPRYSNFVGNFSANCSLFGELIAPKEDEQLCTITNSSRKFSNRIILYENILQDLRGCPFEVMYENAIKLGAIALINVGKKGYLPGRSIYIHSFGQRIGYGSIPFLDIAGDSLSFYRANFLNLSSNSSGIFGRIEGCDDPNVYAKKCIDKVDTILSILSSFPCLYFSFVGLRAIFGLPWHSDNKLLLGCRAGVLFFDGICLGISGIAFFLCGYSRESNSWVGNDVIPYEFKNIFSYSFQGFSLYTTILSAVFYELLLRKVKGGKENSRTFQNAAKAFLIITFIPIVYLDFRIIIENFRYFAPSNSSVVAFCSLGNLILGIVFLCKANSFLKFTRKVMPNQNEKVFITKDPLLQLAIHISRWLRVYAISVALLSFLSVTYFAVLINPENFTEVEGNCRRLYSLYSLGWLTFGSMIAKIQSMKGIKDQRSDSRPTGLFQRFETKRDSLLSLSSSK